jgi:hypothetical protein
VRPIIAASEKVAKQYERGIIEALEQGKNEIYLKDIVTSVSWDSICIYGGYEDPRLLLKNSTQSDHPLLQYFGDNKENQDSLIFLKGGQIVAFYREYSLRNKFSSCASISSAKYIFHKPVAPINISGTYNIDKKRMLEVYETCKPHISNCMTTFIGNPI